MPEVLVPSPVVVEPGVTAPEVVIPEVLVPWPAVVEPVVTPVVEPERSTLSIEPLVAPAESVRMVDSVPEAPVPVVAAPVPVASLVAVLVSQAPSSAEPSTSATKGIGLLVNIILGS